jgi:hypothetical protein
VIYISQLNLFGAQAPALKPVEAPQHDHEREKKNLNFMGDYIPKFTKNRPFFDPFSESITQKTEKWHFGDHRIWGWSVSELHRDMPGSY